MSTPRHGFSLVELLAGLLVLAILLATAAPSFSMLVERNRATAAFHQLTASLAGARIAAVRSGHPVSLCPTLDGRTCRRDLVWDDGWMAFLDPGRAEQPARGEDIIEHTAASGGAIAMRSTPGRHRIRFQPSGWASGANLSLRVCSRDARMLGSVVVNNAGRPRVERQESRPGTCPYSP